MNRHAGPPRGADAPPIPEPTFAERARTLAYVGRTGTLATLSRKHPRYPFASLKPYALDACRHQLVGPRRHAKGRTGPGGMTVLER